MHGSLLLRYRFYPESLEKDFLSVYNDGNGFGSLARVLLPRLRDGLASGDPERFFMWMPFCRRFSERIGYNR